MFNYNCNAPNPGCSCHGVCEGCGKKGSSKKKIEVKKKQSNAPEVWCFKIGEGFPYKTPETSIKTHHFLPKKKKKTTRLNEPLRFGPGRRSPHVRSCSCVLPTSVCTGTLATNYIYSICILLYNLADCSIYLVSLGATSSGDRTG